MNLFKPQARPFHNILPLPTRPLLPPKQNPHRHIPHSSMPVRIHIRKHDFIDQDPRFTIHGRTQILQDCDAGVVGPVVEDAAEVVEAGALFLSVFPAVYLYRFFLEEDRSGHTLNSLLLEEILRHDLHAVDWWQLIYRLR